jgi:hypothetical protein
MYIYILTKRMQSKNEKNVFFYQKNVGVPELAKPGLS